MLCTILPEFNGRWIILGTLAFLSVSVLGVVAVSAILIRLPATYFCESHSREFWIDAHPVLRWTGWVAKNIVGAVLVALGIVMTMPGIPGPGLLTVLLGIMMLDFPGKRRLERWMIRRPKILAAVNRLRQRHGKPPFVLEDVVLEGK